MKLMLRSPFAIAVTTTIFFLGLVSFGINAQETHKLDKKELRALVAGATTTGDHHKLAAHYRAEAEGLTSEQKDHQEEAAEYFRDPSRHPSPKWPTMGQHCRDLAEYYGKAAQKALALAAMHEQMAEEVRHSEASPK